MPFSGIKKARKLPELNRVGGYNRDTFNEKNAIAGRRASKYVR